MVLTNLWSYQLQCGPGEEGRAESLETCIHVRERLVGQKSQITS